MGLMESRGEAREAGDCGGPPHRVRLGSNGFSTLTKEGERSPLTLHLPCLTNHMTRTGQPGLRQARRDHCLRTRPSTGLSAPARLGRGAHLGDAIPHLLLQRGPPALPACRFTDCGGTQFCLKIKRCRAPAWLSRLGVRLRLRIEPRVGLCADSSEPGTYFRFCVSLSLCPSPVHALSLPQK